MVQVSTQNVCVLHSINLFKTDESPIPIFVLYLRPSSLYYFILFYFILFYFIFQPSNASRTRNALFAYSRCSVLPLEPPTRTFEDYGRRAGPRQCDLCGSPYGSAEATSKRLEKCMRHTCLLI